MAGADRIPHQPRFTSEDLDAKTLFSEWSGLFRECLDEAKDFSRKHPGESLAVAFLAGTILGAILGRRS